MEYVVEYKTQDGEWKNAIAHPFFTAKGFLTQEAAEQAKAEREALHPEKEYRVVER